MDEREQLRRSWIANAAAWTDAVRERRIESRRLGTDDAILDAVRALRPRTVLDLGCGEGWLSRALAAEGMSVTGIDGSAELIASANEIGGATFRPLSYEELIVDPKALGTFDVVVANFALFEEDLDSLLIALRMLAGSLVVQTLHPSRDTSLVDGWRVERFQNMPGTWPAPMPWFFRTLASWHALFARTGFTIHATDEPLHPETRQPMSIVWTAAA